MSERVDACAARWGLVVGRRLAADWSWVAEARLGDGTAVVLKLAPEGSGAEAAALALLDGAGAVRLLDAAPELGALLLERLLPGVPLEPLVLSGEDEAATRIAADVMKRLWRPVPAESPPLALPTVRGWGEGFARHRRAHGGGSGSLESDLFGRAEAVFSELAATQAPPVLLHGDLHHGNILSATREPWLAIDPKGVAGEPAYEPGALLRNPFPHLLALPDVRRLTARRLDVLAGELGLERERLRGWAFAQAVLAAVWYLEDEDEGDAGGWRYAMGCAALLEHA